VHLVRKFCNALVTLLAAKENCVQEPFKTIKTIRIYNYILPVRLTA